MERIEIPFGRSKIVAEVNNGCPGEYPSEIYVSVFDEDGKFVQDLAVVRPHYEIDKDGKSWFDDNRADVLIWADPTCDDYTHRFFVDKAKEENK